MKIAVEGCAHGELEKIYETIEALEAENNLKVDLLICCGDFQSTRNMGDLKTMAVSQKYQNMCSFYKYYSGEKVAPILTIFIGGNHEASNHLQELPYGGWVAPNIYYLGYAGVIKINGIRIGGISGIYKGVDYLKGRFEFSPYTESTMRSVYHVRQFEVFRLKQLSGDFDIFLSHDWPRGIYHYGDSNQLCKFKPFFKDEIDSNRLGSPPLEDLLKHLKPKYWFAAHLHCKFAALVNHDDEKVTKFLALDKCLPNRRFLQLIDIEAETKEPLQLEYDLEWLTILKSTNHLLSVKYSNNFMPGPNGKERYEFTPSEEELEETEKTFKDGLKIPENFSAIVEAYNPDNSLDRYQTQPKAMINPQTTQFCDLLGIDDPLVLAMSQSGVELNYSAGSILDISGTSEANSTFNSSILSDGDFSSPLKRKSLSLPEPVKEEGDSEAQSNYQSPLKRKSMTLPDPVNDTVSEADTSQDPSRDPNPDVVILEEIVHSPELKDSPPAAKFKRRNANIYQSSDE